MKQETFWKLLFADACAIAGLFWGEMDGLFAALLILMVLDYITGVLVGIVRKKIDSRIGFKGILRKVLMLVVVAVGHVLDAYVLGGDTDVCRTLVCGFYVANEGISILENTARMGVRYPKKLLNILKQLKTESEEGEKSEDEHSKD